MEVSTATVEGTKIWLMCADTIGGQENRTRRHASQGIDGRLRKGGYRDNLRRANIESTTSQSQVGDSRQLASTGTAGTGTRGIRAGASGGPIEGSMGRSMYDRSAMARERPREREMEEEEEAERRRGTRGAC
ncbi:hypothetical protein B0H17DRAFT_1130680 [Mycena rosella]|uniref:Uncharacterized protein n=1 Tax=Mycena rosella TaxID=1033263 RepID=A0AAD7DR43_MYCRO|nr:hypothetical protein B0H17DRAFT_1130680 [Mycena rosella]